MYMARCDQVGEKFITAWKKWGEMEVFHVESELKLLGQMDDFAIDDDLYAYKPQVNLKM